MRHNNATPKSSHLIFAALLVASLAGVVPAYSQIGMFSKQQLIDFTQAWKGARFPDGRPEVSDSVLERMKNVTAEEAWEVLQPAGYEFQFADGWQVINPGKRLVGRAVTAVFMPLRPDVNNVINEHGKQEKRVGAQNSWIIETLKPGDVMVVDLFGKIKDGTIIGDNLGTSIYSKTHTGLVVDGAVRDTSGLEQIKGFKIYTRGSDPTALKNAMLMGINVPIRIGHTTVMPGDVVLGGPEGVTFIPPEFAEKIVDRSELTHLQDDWGHEMLREGKYPPGKIDGNWTPEMIRQFNAWAAQHGSKLRMKVPQ